jgi:hypothetical protein
MHPTAPNKQQQATSSSNKQTNKQTAATTMEDDSCHPTAAAAAAAAGLVARCPQTPSPPPPPSPPAPTTWQSSSSDSLCSSSSYYYTKEEMDDDHVCDSKYRDLITQDFAIESPRLFRGRYFERDSLVRMLAQHDACTPDHHVIRRQRQRRQQRQRRAVGRGGGVVLDTAAGAAAGAAQTATAGNGNVEPLSLSSLLSSSTIEEEVLVVPNPERQWIKNPNGGVGPDLLVPRSEIQASINTVPCKKTVTVIRNAVAQYHWREKRRAAYESKREKQR